MPDFYCDTNTIKKWELTPENYLRVWVTFGVPDQTLEYETDSGKRLEFIDKDSLLNQDSLQTLIGKPLTLNHPPIPIVSANWNDFAKGFTMQHITDNDDIAVISAVIHDSEIANRIIKGEITKTSSAYYADKVLQSDGRYKQVKRHYNHIALLTDDFEPRAGTKSEIVLDSIKTMSKPQTDTTTATVETIVETAKENATLAAETIAGIVENAEENAGKTAESTLSEVVETANDRVLALLTELKSMLSEIRTDTPEQPKTQSDSTQPTATNDVSERVQLWSEWKSYLESHNKTIDYSLDASGIKKLVLSCAYDEATIGKLNNDSVLSGFWINFELNKDSLAKPKTTSKTAQFDSGEDWEKEFIARTTKTA